jgi:hypothetical protein
MTLNSPPEATERIRNDSLPSLKEVCGNQVSEHFSNMIAWALEPEEQNRPQTGKEWFEALSNQAAATVRVGQPEAKKVNAESGQEAQSAPSASKSRLPLIAAAAGVVLLAGVALVISNIAKIGNTDESTLRGQAPIAQSSESIPADQHVEKPPVQTKPKPAVKPAEKPRQPEAPKKAPSGASPQEESDFAIAKQIGVREAYMLFLRRHPKGRYAEIAKVKMENL